MPRSLDPNARLTMVLACDVDKPKEQQPIIYGRCLTGRQEREVASLFEQFEKAQSLHDKFAAAHAAAAVCISGWSLMTHPETGEPLPFSADAIADVLNTEEMMEVVMFVMGGTKATADDKKKSELPPS